MEKEKIYMNLFLDPLPVDELALNADEDDDYDAIQLEKQRIAEERRKKFDARTEKYQ